MQGQCIDLPPDSVPLPIQRPARQLWPMSGLFLVDVYGYTWLCAKASYVGIYFRLRPILWMHHDCVVVLTVIFQSVGRWRHNFEQLKVGNESFAPKVCFLLDFVAHSAAAFLPKLIHELLMGVLNENHVKFWVEENNISNSTPLDWILTKIVGLWMLESTCNNT